MRLKFILSVILVHLTIVVSGQNHTWIGAESGFKFIGFNVTETGTRIMTPAIPGLLKGFTAAQELKKNFLIEGGFYQNNFWNGYGFMGFGNPMWNGNETWQIPLRLKYRQAVVEEKIGVVPHLGGSLFLIRYYGSGYGYGTMSSGAFGDTIIQNYQTRPVSYTRFVLLETGLALDFNLAKSLKLQIMSIYQIGFIKLVEIDVNYTVNGGPVQTGVVYSYGNNLSVLIGLKYRISSLWFPDPLRERSYFQFKD